MAISLTQVSPHASFADFRVNYSSVSFVLVQEKLFDEDSCGVGKVVLVVLFGKPVTLVFRHEEPDRGAIFL